MHSEVLFFWMIDGYSVSIPLAFFLLLIDYWLVSLSKQSFSFMSDLAQNFGQGALREHNVL